MPVVTVDLHTHLREKREKPARYWKAVRARKIDAVAIAEHVNCKPRKAFEALAENKPRSVALLPAMELNTDIGHVLAYGGDAEIYGIEGLYRRGLPIKKAQRIAAREQLMLSIAHPWGLSYDSAAYLMGERRLERLVKKGGIGVEVYNGMVGSLGNFVYGTNWVRKPMNFFDFLERSRIARKTRLSRLGEKAREKLDRKGREIIERCAKPIMLGTKADFITAGSDGHSAARIGSGIMRIRINGKPTPKKILEALPEKSKIVWAGPFLRQTKSGRIIFDSAGLGRKEVLQGIGYAAKKVLGRKMRLRRSRKFLK